tara:strand:- start:1584 stop:2231 length:648 start_codon:yes stop_codon:yes gene_type:complete
MSFVNFSKKEISFKIVYYGAPLCGKTTNLEQVHASVPEGARGPMTMLSTRQDRTLYFDFLPLETDVIKGFISRFQLYTVPGQAIYNLTRRLVLNDVDGMVFVCDSQFDQMENNVESFKNLEENLGMDGRDLTEMPYVLQYNKRDLTEIAPTHYLDFMLNNRETRVETFDAVALKGEGVHETLNTIAKLVMAKFIKDHNMEMGSALKTTQVAGKDA